MLKSLEVVLAVLVTPQRVLHSPHAVLCILSRWEKSLICDTTIQMIAGRMSQK
jgi:hypothetical protein